MATRGQLERHDDPGPAFTKDPITHDVLDDRIDGDRRGGSEAGTAEEDEQDDEGC